MATVAGRAFVVPGSDPPAEFDAWLRFQQTSPVFINREARRFRAEAGHG